MVYCQTDTPGEVHAFHPLKGMIHFGCLDTRAEQVIPGARSDLLARKGLTTLL